MGSHPCHSGNQRTASSGRRPGCRRRRPARVRRRGVDPGVHRECAVIRVSRLATPQAGSSSVVLARRRPRRKPRTYLMEPGPEYFAS